ncbi:ABC transporter ATP-binding protein [Kushneria aurantia]|uniref:ABC transporter ATP-binding protein n=1 Tax=Kushneria aurantia TaxID=504092 RepID=A0ABV6FZB1_9GAMM|nr:sn-glycerol-3-phosphate ABC transporter ATP-binding protein UgpC [Kushneria aurantia]
MSHAEAIQSTHHTAGLRLNRLHKSFKGDEVLHDINLDVEAGEFVVFVGPSGCGKSTLLRLIAGLEETTAGDIFIGDDDVTERDPSDRGIAMVFQTYALYPHMSVADNMGFGLRAARHPKQEIADKVNEAAQILHLTDLLQRRPSQLSGGQRQRVAIGRAIVRDPDVFLFDEPLSNLDAELRVEMRLEIARLHRQLGNTMIYVTHDQTEAMTLASRIVVLRAGCIEQVGTPADLYSDPDNVFVAGFIGSPAMNFFDAELVENGRLRLGEHTIAGPRLDNPPSAGTGVTLGIRPVHLQPVQGDVAGLQFRVEFIEYLGDNSCLHGALDNGARCRIEAPRGIAIRLGETLLVSAEVADMRLFDQQEQRLR